MDQKTEQSLNAKIFLTSKLGPLSVVDELQSWSQLMPSRHPDLRNMALSSKHHHFKCAHPLIQQSWK